MNDLVPANSERKPVQKPRISKRLKRALDLWLTGKVGDRKTAAEKAGLTAEYFCRALKKPHVMVVCRTWAEDNIGVATLRASSRVRELLDGESEHVAGKVALRLLESERLIAPAGVQSGPVIHAHGPLGILVDWRNDRDPKPLSLEDQETVEKWQRGEIVGAVIGEARDTLSRGREPQTIEHQGEGEDDAGDR
jgi:hypothetical protein